MTQQDLVFDFTAGELSPTFMGRFDLPIYKKGAKSLENAIPVIPGGFTMRPGTIDIGATNIDGKVILIPWLVSPTLNYVVELSAGGDIRFWRDGALLMLGGSPLVMSSASAAYTVSQIPEVMYAQDDTRMIFTHGNYPVMELTFNAIDTFGYGPLSIEIYAGQTTPFQSAGNYPRACAFHEGRLILASTDAEPGGAWGSRPFEPGDFACWDTILSTSTQVREPYNTFTGTTSNGSSTVSGITAAEIEGFLVGDHITGTGIPSGTTEAARTFIQSIGSTSIVLTKNATASGTVTLVDGWHDPLMPEYHDVADSRDIITAGDGFHLEIADRILWLASGQDLIVGCLRGERIIPAGIAPPVIQCQRQTCHGSAPIQPFMAFDSVMFVDGATRGIREYIYVDKQAAYQSPMISFTSGHLFTPGIVAIDYANTPYPFLWAVLADGTLAGCLFARDYGVMAWFPVDVDGLVESIAVVPDDTLLQDAVYLSVNRGGLRRIERFGKWDMSEGHLDASGTATKTAGVITGLARLNGETITVTHGGNIYPNIAVAGGSATIPVAVANGQVVAYGLPFLMHVETMPVNARSQIGTAHMRPVNVTRAIFRVCESETFEVGSNAIDREIVPIVGTLSGDYAMPIRGAWDTEGTIHVYQDDPRDTTILAIQIEVDAGG